MPTPSIVERAFVLEIDQQSHAGSIERRLRIGAESGNAEDDEEGEDRDVAIAIEHAEPVAKMDLRRPWPHEWAACIAKEALGFGRLHAIAEPVERPVDRVSVGRSGTV